MARVGRGTDRGVSTAVSYVLNLGVAVILFSALLVGAGGLVEDQREDVVRGELRVVGQRLASDLLDADRLARTTDGDVRIRSELPRGVAGLDYRIAVAVSGDDATLVLTTSDPSVRVAVSLANETAVEAGTVGAGPVLVETDDGTLEVRRDA
jgi:hypothetical protein